MHIALLILDVLIHLWFPSVTALCPSGRFGVNCSGVCHCLLGPEVCHSEDGRCKEGPCKPGWTNLPLCQTECPKGLFGLNCTWTCHCNTVEECNAVNGHCASNECASEWTGPSCQNRLPVLTEPPVVRSISHSQVTIAWYTFEHTESSANINISSYQVQMLSATEDDWVDVDVVLASTYTEEYSFTTPKLELNQNYKFRIAIIWLNSNKPQTSTPGPETDWVYIACREPTGGPRSLNARVISRGADTIKISWLSLVGDSGCERYDWLMINLTCTPDCHPISQKVVLPSSSSFVAISQRNRSSSTIVTMKVQAFNNAGLGSQKISEIRVKLFPNDHYDLAYNSSRPTDHTETYDVSGVNEIKDVSTVSKVVISMSKYITEAPVAVTDVTANATNITDNDHNKTVFNAASGAINLGNDAFPETTSSSSSYTGDLFSVIPAPYSQSTSPSRVQQKRYQLLKRSQHMMSFLETPSDQSSNDSTGALQVTVKEVDSLYSIVSNGPPGITIGHNRSIVISNLKAGTLYQVDVASHLVNSSDVAVIFSASYWTFMQAPPKLSPPQLIDISNTSITLKVSLPRLGKRSFASVSIAYGLRVVVEPDLNDGSRFKALTESVDVFINDTMAISSEENPLQGYRNKGAAPYYVALEIEDPPKDSVIVVGDDQVYGKQGEYYNVALMSNTRYWLWIGLTSSLDGVMQLALTPFEYPVRTVGLMSLDMMESSREGGGGGGLGAGSVAAIVLAVILFLLIVFLVALWWYLKYKKCKSAATNEPTYGPSSALADKNLDTVFAEESRVDEVQIEQRKQKPNTFDVSFYVMKSTQPIPVHKLRHHYETHLRPNSHYALQDEFRRLPEGFTDTTNVSNLAYNVSFNRSQAIVPYDKNRVKLARQFPNDNTYINASFIRTIGYRSCIVTQCPLASTANEFWRMVWEMRVGTIVMLVESKESNGPEYYKYWPRKSKPIYYHDVKVQLMREERMAHHEVRELRVSCMSDKIEVRRVIHWQYVQWKPGGIPGHPIPFLNMVAAIQEEHDPESGFVIHCLKGGGRSGIYAAVDALVNEGKQSGKVDVLECVTLLRLERVNLVKSLKQYRFVYHCLIEAFNCHETRTPVHRFHFMLANLLARNELDSLTRFEKEYSAVQLECYAVRPYLFATSFGTNVGTRFASPDHKKLANSDGSGKYGILPFDQMDIPATVPLDGCFTKDAFLLSSPPEKANLDAFWDMINENNASCIVMLNKAEELPFAERFLPDDGSSVDLGKYTVHCDSVLIHPNSSFYVHNLNIALKNNNNSTNAMNSIRLYEFAKWPESLEVPLIDAALDLTINVADWSQRIGGGRPVVMFSIHGGDKARAAVFAIVWRMIDPIQYDGVVDVYSAARYVYSYMPNAITSVEQYHFLYRVMEEHVIRIEKHKWRPEKVSESFTPSVLLKNYKSDGNGEEGVDSMSLGKPGKRRKLKRLSSDGSAFQNLKKKKKDAKGVTVDQTVTNAESNIDDDQGIVDGMRKLETDADCKRFPVAEESNERWQSPDKTGIWPYPDLKMPNDASTDESNRGLLAPEDTSKTGKKALSRKIPDDQDSVAKQMSAEEIRVRQEKPEVKPRTQKLDKYEASELLPPCSSDRRLRDQVEVTEPSLRSLVGRETSAPASVPVDIHRKSAKCAKRPSPLTSTSSDEPSPTSQKHPVPIPPCRMRCKCKMTSDSKGSPCRRLQCRCKMAQDSASMHSGQTDDSGKQRRPPSANDTVTTTARLTTPDRQKSRKDKLELPDRKGRLKQNLNFPSESLSDEQIHKLSDRSLAKAEMKRRGRSLKRDVPECQFICSSSSVESIGTADMPCKRQGKSRKSPELMQQGQILEKSSSLEKHIQKGSPSRVGKYAQKFDQKEDKSSSQNKKPCGSYKEVNSQTKLSNEKLSGRCPSRKGRDVNEMQPAEVLAPDRKCLKKSTPKSSPEGGTSAYLPSTEKKSPAVWTSSQSDDMENISLSTGPKLKTPQKFTATLQAEDEMDRRCCSPERSSSQEDNFTRTSRLKDRSPQASRRQDATDSKAASQSPSLEEKSQIGSRPRPKTRTKMSPSQEVSRVGQRKKRSPVLSKEEELNYPSSRFTSEKQARMSPVFGVKTPKRSKSPAQSPFREVKSPRYGATDQKRCRRSPSQEAASPKRSRLSSRSSSRGRSSGKSPPGGDKFLQRKHNLEVPGTHRALTPSSGSNQHHTALSSGRSAENDDRDRKHLAKMPPPKIGATVPADFSCSKEAYCDVLNSPQTSVTKADKSSVHSVGKHPTDYETSQEAKYHLPSAQAAPSNVGREFKQQIPNACTPNVTGNTVRSRADESRAFKDEEQPKMDSLSDLSIDTRLTLERAQAKLEQKDSKTQDIKPDAKAHTERKGLQNVKQDFQVYGIQNPKSANQTGRDANALPPNETTVPCSKRRVKQPEIDISLDLLGALSYPSSVASMKSVPSTDARQWSQSGLRSGPSKATDSLSAEKTAGIHSASPKSGVTHVAPPPSQCGQGFHPSDSDIAYIDDTDSGSAH